MEMMSSTDTAFKLFDKDKDGFITRAEFAKVPFSNLSFDFQTYSNPLNASIDGKKKI